MHIWGVQQLICFERGDDDVRTAWGRVECCGDNVIGHDTAISFANTNLIHVDTVLAQAPFLDFIIILYSEKINNIFILLCKYVIERYALHVEVKAAHSPSSDDNLPFVGCHTLLCYLHKLSKVI